MNHSAGIRIDKWLWYARFFKSRSLASKKATDGKIRINGEKTGRASSQIRTGDILTFAQGDSIRVIKVIALGTRRGPASEAVTLYEDLEPPERQKSEKSKEPKVGKPFARPSGAGRPTKRDRREIATLQNLRGEK